MHVACQKSGLFVDRAAQESVGLKQGRRMFAESKAACDFVSTNDTLGHRVAE